MYILDLFYHRTIEANLGGKKQTKTRNSDRINASVELSIAGTAQYCFYHYIYYNICNYTQSMKGQQQYSVL